MDENAVTQLRNEKYALIKERNEANQRANIAEHNYNDLSARWNLIWSYPEMVSTWDAILEDQKRQRLAQEEKSRREAEAKENAKTTLLDKCILAARDEIQKFGKSGKNDYDDPQQINIVLCGILAMASKLNINIEDITQKLLQDMFCMIMLVETKNEKSDFAKQLRERAKDMQIRVVPSSDNEKVQDMDDAELQRVIKSFWSN